MIVLGLQGYSGVGKDTTFAVLKRLMPHRLVLRVAMATKVKQIAEALYGELGLDSAEHYDFNREERKLKLPGINKTPIELWCDVGDKARETYENVWVDHAWLQIEKLRASVAPDIVCITDIRYPNEAYSIQGRAIAGIRGVLCSVINPRITPLNTQADHGMDNWDGQYDYRLLNDGSPERLEGRIGELSKMLDLYLPILTK